MNKLKPAFFEGEDVCRIAQSLLGKTLACQVDGVITKGIVVETEAYSESEKGCHAYNGKRTPRTEVMFGEPGHAYVYLCYGVHRLFNVVTNKKGVAEAILIRAIEPVQTESEIAHRAWAGPGKLTKGMSIGMEHNAVSVCGNQLWFESGTVIDNESIVAVPRIGIDYAGEDAQLPWRFYVKDNLHVSKY